MIRAAAPCARLLGTEIGKRARPPPARQPGHHARRVMKRVPTDITSALFDAAYVLRRCNYINQTSQID
ncbi:unnamed protein product [Colias eurytheme]|nr:unnamed protein product [Colias eurytheme]